MSILKQWLEIQQERAKTHKALRLLTKQEWSVEFLTALLIRASNVVHRPLEMTIVHKNGMSIRINTIDTSESSTYRDDSIFNHLDDELKVRQFIEEVNRK